MANELVSFADIGMMAKAVSDSGLFGIKTEAQAFSLMCLAQATGLSPMMAATQYHIIDGKPALKSDAILTRFQNAGGKIKWLERNDTCAKLWLSHPAGGELTIQWDMERAKRAGLANKKQWIAYPAQMLSARCVSEGVRAVFPACLDGMYTPEEVRDFDAVPPAPAPTQKVLTDSPKPKAKAKKSAQKLAQDAEIAAMDNEIKTMQITEIQTPEPRTGSPKTEPATAQKATRTPEDLQKNFRVWARSQMENKGDEAVLNAIGFSGYESIEEVPADAQILKKITKAISDIPNKPAQTDLPF